MESAFLATVRGVFNICEPVRKSSAAKLDVVALFEAGPDPGNFDRTLQRALAQYDPATYRVLVWMEGSAAPDAVPWYSCENGPHGRCAKTVATIRIQSAALLLWQ